MSLHKVNPLIYLPPNIEITLPEVLLPKNYIYSLKANIILLPNKIDQLCLFMNFT